jgi:hypothetical protein
MAFSAAELHRFRPDVELEQTIEIAAMFEINTYNRAKNQVSQHRFVCLLHF